MKFSETNYLLVFLKRSAWTICVFWLFYVTAYDGQSAAAQDRGPKPGFRCPANAIFLEPGTSWRAKVQLAPRNAIFCARSGIHRAQTVYPKDNQQFLGEPGAIMNGTVVLNDFKRSGSHWTAPAPHWEPQVRGQCLPDKPTCNDPTTLFVNSRPLEQVLSLKQVRPGTFFQDKATGTFYFADDPRGNTVEATAATFAFMPNHAKNVTVSGLVVEKYGNPAQLGAIYADADATASGWLIRNNEVRLNSGSGIVGGEGAIVRDNWVHNNGHLGVHPHGDSVLVENNEIAFNNTRGFDPQWDAGGLKAAVVNNLVVRNNWVHHNHGGGLWCDIECRNVTFTENVIENNTDAGIAYEISYDARIVNNLVRWNGRGGPGSSVHSWTSGAEIQIAGSENVEVAHNVVFVDKDAGAILLIDQGRDRDGKRDYYRTIKDTVHDNQIWLYGSGAKIGGISDVPAGDPDYAIIETGDNSFDRNQYHVSQDKCYCMFAWGHITYDFAGFQGVGQERHGQVLTNSAEPQAPPTASADPPK